MKFKRFWYGRNGLAALLLAYLITGHLPAFALSTEGQNLEHEANTLIAVDKPEEALKKLQQAASSSPNDWLLLLKLAGVYTDLGRTGDAVNAYQQALSIQPDEPMARFSMGQLFEQLNQPDRAEQCYIQGLRQNPLYRYGLFSLARVQAAQQRYNEAITSYLDFLAYYPNQYDARRQLAQLYLATNNPSQAIHHYELLKQTFPARFSDSLSLAKAYNRANQPEQAKVLLAALGEPARKKADVQEELGVSSELLDEQSNAINHYQEALKLGNPNSQLYLQLAKLYETQKEPEKAITAYQHFLKDHPEESPVRFGLASVYLDTQAFDKAITELDTLLSKAATDNQSLGVPLYEVKKSKAYALQRKGNLSEAIALYESLQSEPEANGDTQLIKNLAIAYHQDGKLEAAVDCYRTFLSQEGGESSGKDATLSNDLANVLVALGDRAYTQKDYHKAQGLYEEAKTYAATDNPLPLLGLANVYYLSQYTDPEALHKSFNLYQQVLKLKPNHPLATLYKAKIQLSLPDGKTPAVLDAVVADLTRLSEKYPDQLDILLTLGDAYRQKGDLDAALKPLAIATERYPKQDVAWLSWATVLQAKGKNSDAIQGFEKACALNPDLSAAWLNLGSLYHQENQLDKAIQSYEMALAKNPALAEAEYGLAISFDKQQNFPLALEHYNAYLNQPEGEFQAVARERVEVLTSLLEDVPTPLLQDAL